jgi:hypothetical protein
MRVVHFASSVTGHAEPLCGLWGSMDTDWTKAEEGVTCAGCQLALRDAGPGASPPGPPGRDGGAV